MDTETPPLQDHDFVSSQWVDMGGYAATQHHQLTDFTGFQFGSSPIMPIEPAYSMSMPQPYTTQHLIPLTMSSQWPSMLSTQPGFAPMPVAPMPMTPIPPQIQHVQTPQLSTPPTPRRTLTDAERRRMCLYHQENPHVKQTEIGAMFGVERSTVSKVLRQKEKYLFPDDGRRSPVKKAKGKFPDIERALSNWVKNHQRQGGEINDALIREKAMFFASTVGSPEGHEKILTSSWLEKFKQKNYIVNSPGRKSSLDITSPRKRSTIRTPTQLSPISPSSTTTPSSTSPTQSGSVQEGDLVNECSDDVFGVSLPQEGTPIATPTLARATSESTIIFSSQNPFAPSENTGLGLESKRRRSQTLPVMTSGSSVVKDESPESLSPTNIFTQPGVIEEEGDPSEFIDATAMKRNRSNPEIISNVTPMQPPPLPKSKSISSPAISPTTTPTQDEARQALELVLNYFKNQSMELAVSDYQIIGKLMEKLKLAHGQPYIQPMKSTTSRSKIHTDRPRVSKKRSIHTL
ncbi:hypothetical protein H112_07860 [Trichophyton rubrum D6]|uniref:HTH CENPB-type domain-containing protein n=2 Tax=Trichophyton rubrum TaxID=5551 RepID=A0A178ETP2_TRIRU|nr:hypothetical protein H100_07887 [Trichophyton rubrum MR850]EZF37809.1 hypothetical protein H102_07847 [Trichophyton rubrum CBS 100081]EZF48470.1 hypothetical protein H103_07872 [Trichophyton rubrum CBS 288.86]EZF59072.1 hypothetical protein H104_07819 [Trichophyton rubrum CBS 289.86]EZF80405.1 hypothetical protein H110_07873 [Trichophyton rubrum MR1448]EZF91082.1 hypothetical protein H113_07930 [Trichophyton rubrum MR1459]EZG12645.1 hypothetical protein H107_08011 [Trichophyton rubrum CBS 